MRLLANVLRGSLPPFQTLNQDYWAGLPSHGSLRTLLHPVEQGLLGLWPWVRHRLARRLFNIEAKLTSLQPAREIAGLIDPFVFRLDSDSVRRRVTV